MFIWGIVLRTHLFQTAACDSARAVTRPEGATQSSAEAAKAWVGASEPAKGASAAAVNGSTGDNSRVMSRRLLSRCHVPGASLVAQRESVHLARRRCSSVSGSGRSLGEGSGNPFLYSCLGNPMGRGAWRGSVHGVAKSRTRRSTRAHTQVEKSCV